MTDISVSSTAFQVEKRSWLIVQPGVIGPGFTQSIVLDVSMFTSGTHYPNGYFPSGLNLARITGTGQGGVVGLYGPYDDAATDGRQTFACHLFSSVKVPNTLDTTKDVGAAGLFAFAVVKLAKLPIALDANGQTDGKAQFLYYIP